MQWWEQSPSTNVAPEFEYRRRSHIRVLRFSPLLKNHHFQITIRYGTHGHLDLLCFMGKQITIFLILSRVKRACLDRFSSLPAPLGFLQCPVTIFTVTTWDKCLCDNLKQCRYSVAMPCCAKNLRCESFLVPEFYGTFLHSSTIQDWRHITIVKNDTIDHHHNLSF